MENINNILIKCYEEACPIKIIKSSTKIPWWTSNLTELKNKCKKAKKVATKNRSQEDYDKLKQLEKDYSTQMEKERKMSWQNYCTNINKYKDLAKLPKPNNRHKEQLHCLEITEDNKDSNLPQDKNRQPKTRLTTSSKETLLTLTNTLFPETENAEEVKLIDTEMDNNKLIDDITAEKSLDSIIKQLQKNKTPGTDGIRNEIIQHSWELIRKQIIHIFKYSLKLQHIPKPWHNSKGIIIAKPNKKSYCWTFRVHV